MVAIISLLLVLYVTLFISRVATAVLVRTGLSQEIARFQAWSAITGCGFTTAESELVVSHPVRRRIIRILMLFGNIGIIAAVASSILGFISNDFSHWLKLALLAFGLAGLWVLAGSRRVDNWSARKFDRLLRQRSALGFSNCNILYHLPEGYRVTSLVIDRNSPWSNQPLHDCGFAAGHVTLLGIQSGGKPYQATPPDDLVLNNGDVLTLYARQNDLEQLLAAATAPKPANPPAATAPTHSE